MKRVESMEQILISWERCMKGGITSNINSSLFRLNDDEFKEAVKENKLLITVFDSCMEKIRELIAVNNSAFALVDAKGNLLKKNQI